VVAELTSGAPSRVRVHPGPLSGRVRVPGDKSLSHRALIIGALAGGTVEVEGLAPSGDVASTAGALRGLGATLELSEEPDGLAGTVRGPLEEPEDVIDCGNSGTSLRLLAGVAAGLDGLTVLTGDATLRRRPVDRVAVPLRRMGATLAARGGDRYPPLAVRGGDLDAVTYDSPVASAQVKSSILLAGLRARGTTVVTSPLRSRDHTERMLRYLGADLERDEFPDGTEQVRLRGDGRLRPRPLRVPGDPSSAAFWLVAGVGTGGSGSQREIVLSEVCVNPTRTGVVEVLRALGAEIAIEPTGEVAGEPVADITVRSGETGAAEVDGALVVDAIDELPILAVAGALSQEGLDVREAAELRVKESDRIAAIVRLLGALGVPVEERPDGFRVPGGHRLEAGTVDAGGDHRIAMAAAVAATFAQGPVTIDGFGAVTTSYPSFLDDLRRLGGDAEVLA
jgi:3-phosphoshikimate 1-carboxyvinyltransferase